MRFSAAAAAAVAVSLVSGWPALASPTPKGDDAVALTRRLGDDTKDDFKDIQKKYSLSTFATNSPAKEKCPRWISSAGGARENSQWLLDTIYTKKKSSNPFRTVKDKALHQQQGLTAVAQANFDKDVTNLLFQVDLGGTVDTVKGVKMTLSELVLYEAMAALNHPPIENPSKLGAEIGEQVAAKSIKGKLKKISLFGLTSITKSSDRNWASFAKKMLKDYNIDISKTKAKKDYANGLAIDVQGHHEDKVEEQLSAKAIRKALKEREDVFGDVAIEGWVIGVETGKGEEGWNYNLAAKLTTEKDKAKKVDGKAILLPVTGLRNNPFSGWRNKLSSGLDKLKNGGTKPVSGSSGNMIGFGSGGR